MDGLFFRELFRWKRCGVADWERDSGYAHVSKFHWGNLINVLMDLPTRNARQLKSQ